jgi:hypothetical protein
MNIDKKGKLNELLKHWRPGVLFFSSWLNKHGYSDQLMQQYRKSGWFSSLSKAVMHRTGDKLSTFGAISSYNVTIRPSTSFGIKNTDNYSNSHLTFPNSGKLRQLLNSGSC